MSFVRLENAQTNSYNAPPAKPGQQRQYVVRSGDTLSAIALRELGNANRWTEIKKPGGGTFTEAEARNLQVGQSVYLPVSYPTGTGKPVTPTPSPGTSPSTVSEAGLRFIAGHEGIRLKLYNDPAGHCTIGVGHLVHLGNCNGSEPAEFRGGISEQRAYELLRADVNTAVKAVKSLVKVPLNQQQFDALVSFTFNLGAGSLQQSDLLKRLNAGEYSAVPTELNRWVYGGGVKLPGLVRRRNEEGILFRDGIYTGVGNPPNSSPIPGGSNPVNNQPTPIQFVDPTTIRFKDPKDPLRGISKFDNLDFQGVRELGTAVTESTSTWRQTDVKGQFRTWSSLLDDWILGPIRRFAAQRLEDTLWHFFELVGLPRANRHLRHFLVQEQDPGKPIEDISVDDMLKYIPGLQNLYNQGKERAKDIVQEVWTQVSQSKKRIAGGSYWIAPTVDVDNDKNPMTSNNGFSSGKNLLPLIDINAWIRGDETAKNILDFYCVLGNFQSATSAKIIVKNDGNFTISFQMRIHDDFNFDMKLVDTLMGVLKPDKKVALKAAIDGFARAFQSSIPETLVRLGMANNYKQWGGSSIENINGRFNGDGSISWLP
ncbi:MAG: hypothetical protein EAZ28_13075 [Oscillatoriales cyanobacterium]|nr:MAG: hypothetical protein EAZ28_13075 [Oscillatoriales cyanobacterium]